MQRLTTVWTVLVSHTVLSHAAPGWRAARSHCTEGALMFREDMSALAGQVNGQKLRAKFADLSRRLFSPPPGLPPAVLQHGSLARPV